MRAPTLLSALLLALLFPVATIDAQDIQYRMVTRSTMPGMAMQAPEQTMTMSLKGAAIRMDMQLPGTTGTMTTIMDVSAHRILVLNHAERTYMEQPFAGPLTNVDTAAVRKAAAVLPKIRETRETMRIGGYNARRLILSYELGNAPPGMGGKPGMKLVMASNQWVTDDARLLAASRAIAKTMSKNDPVALSLAAQKNPGFPLRSTTVVVELPEKATYDAEALLKAGERAEGLKMYMTMEARDIKLGTLDSALFTLPKGYSKQ